jgi:hypothetical protein
MRSSIIYNLLRIKQVAWVAETEISMVQYHFSIKGASVVKAQSEAWLSRVADAANGLPDWQRTDFMHVAYLTGAKAVLRSLAEGDPEDARPRIEVSAGFDKPDDPVSHYWLIQRAPLDAESTPLPLTSAGRLSFFVKTEPNILPSFTIRKKELGEDSARFPDQVTLLDMPTPETRSMDRTQADLNTFGYNLQVVARALGFPLPEPDDIPKLVLIES